MKKILTCAVITVVLLGLCGALALNAQAKSGNGFYSSIIQKLVEKFNLNAEEVQEVFDEARDEMRQEAQARFEERAGGKMDKMPEFNQLTDEQKEALSAKREELREKFEALKDISPEERQAKMEELREELESWAEENGIDSKVLFRFGFGGGFKRCPFGQRGGFGSQFGR